MADTPRGLSWWRIRQGTVVLFALTLLTVACATSSPVQSDSSVAAAPTSDADATGPTVEIAVEATPEPTATETPTATPAPTATEPTATPAPTPIPALTFADVRSAFAGVCTQQPLVFEDADLLPTGDKIAAFGPGTVSWQFDNLQLSNGGRPAMVVCVEHEIVRSETCAYTPEGDLFATLDVGRDLEFRAVDIVLTSFSPWTGEPIGERTVAATGGGTCPETVPNQFVPSINIVEPSLAMIESALDELLAEINALPVPQVTPGSSVNAEPTVPPELALNFGDVRDAFEALCVGEPLIVDDAHLLPTGGDIAVFGPRPGPWRLLGEFGRLQVDEGGRPAMVVCTAEGLARSETCTYVVSSLRLGDPDEEITREFQATSLELRAFSAWTGEFIRDVTLTGAGGSCTDSISTDSPDVIISEPTWTQIQSTLAALLEDAALLPIPTATPTADE